MKHLQAVILDWAGTTVDYGSCAPAGVFVDVFRRKGIEISFDQARVPMGLDKKKHIQTLLEMEPVSYQWKKRFGKAWDSQDLDTLYQDFIPMQLQCLKDYSQLIPGVLEAIQKLKKQGFKIGTTTGYNREMIEIVAHEAKKQGFEPDAVVCSSDVLAGRPHPWMAFEAAHRMGVYPMDTIVKIGDTRADVEEGLNAGMWTIGVTKTGNELGLNEKAAKALNPETLSQRLAQARDRLLSAGAHYTAESVEEILPIIDKINLRLSRGDRP